MAVNDLVTFRKGTATQWTSVNPILASGEPGYDLTNGVLKIGDGASSWDQLSAIGGGSGGTSITNASNNRILTSDGTSAGINAESGLTFDGSLLSAPSGDFTNSLQVNGTGVSLTGHTHTASDITDFNSSVSGLLPVKSLVAGTGISLSSSAGTYTINSTSSSSTSIYSYVAPSAFPVSGADSTLYIATDSGRNYIWNGSSYSEVGPIGNGDLSLWNLLLPGAPTAVTGTTGSGQVALSWTAPTFVGVPITDYAIQYSSNSGTSWTTFSDGTSTATSATVTGLTNGSGYIFRVAAINSIGQGSYSTNSSSYIPGGDPYFSSVSLLLLLDGSNNSTTFTDSGPVGHTVSTTNAIISTTQSKFGGSSLYLNNNAYLSVPSHTSLTIGTGDFTIEFWAYCTDQSNPYPGYISSQGGWSAGAYGIRFDNTNAAQRWGFWKNPSDPLMTTSSTYSFNTWRHIALVRQSGTWRMYVDGVQGCSSTTQGSDSFDLAYGGTMRIGFGTWDGSNGYATDYIDCLRITKGVCRYPDGTTFTPSSTAFTAYQRN